MNTPITFTPIYQERVWGGRRLEALPGRRLPGGGAPIGESWEIVDRPEAQSVVASGRFAGLSIRELLERHAGEVIGPGRDPARPFPILVKWLDCRERLSLQVHPPAEVAAKTGGEPKTENWYMAAADTGAGLLVGLKPGVTRDRFAEAIERDEVEDCVLRHDVRPGDSVLVRSGVVHAIDAGCFILEIQQNSDTTYRVYDWGRVGLDGKPRTLHIRESLESILFDSPAPNLLRRPADGAVLADCAEFRLVRRTLGQGEALEFNAGEDVRLLHVVEGDVEDDQGNRFERGSNLLLAYAGAFRFRAENGATALVTERIY